MQFLPLALSWEAWLMANAVYITTGSTIITLIIVYANKNRIIAELQRRKIGIKLGLIEPYEQDALIRREKLESLFDRLENIFKRTKTRSERVPRLKAFGIDSKVALKGRERKYSLILDQIRKIAIHVTTLEDMNEILEIRTMLEKAVNDIGGMDLNDALAADIEDARDKLNDMVANINDAIALIEEEDEAAMSEQIPAEWLLNEEKPDDETNTESAPEPNSPPPSETIRDLKRKAVESLLCAANNENNQDLADDTEDVIDEDEEEEPPQRQAMLA